ncbi:23S rRNA (guanosine(2251)-2'-O)-methyltransferase RlmB [Sarcina sp. JB2]|uniref:23S rRNA (Guanosine(2251)-2'-O)-methyltransferase RlmB n=1 Tax=Candidatus Sarcina troglodytae TaxID=2726954 RepID=A0ACD1BFR6_9CLOT|nr:23S rRNA (guanosine(2251)-2'-O)-methyltransferase RlmB [Sarcina sp. JB2]QPJ86188.1 23S rRNA (guanosine(2251)-2'-O)-methyltransferase RlmB [Sarcina sp. JB2]
MTKSENKYKHLTRKQKYFADSVNKGHDKRNNNEENYIKQREDLVEGRNAVIELLKSNKTIEQLFIANGKMEGSINKILGLAKDKGVIVKEVDRKKLDLMSETKAHQGVIAQITPFKYSTVDEILNYAKQKDEDPFIVILDELEDPHNLGSIVRTAELCGVHGIIIPKRRNVGVTATVYKASVGAIEYVKIAKVINVNSTIDELKAKNIWVYGADINGEEYSYDTNFNGACAIVIGNEGKGISKLTKNKCDKLVKIPMVGKINSLNASVAGGIMMYEVLKGRIKK